MKLAIYGAGSLGTILGAYITRNGYAIDLISRNKSHIRGLKTKGARITGTVKMTVPVKALLPEEITGKYDIIFLMTKTVDNEAAIKQCSRRLTGNGIICTMQNGLPEMSVSEIIGEDRTFGCSVEWGATLIGDGMCELTSEEDSITFSLGSFSRNPDVEKLQQLKTILESMGHVDIEKNFIGARWSKLLINSSFSGMSAALGCTFGEAAENKTSRLCIQRIMKECIDVSKKAGIKIEPVQGKDICRLFDYQTAIKRYFSFLLIPFAIRKHRLLKASMLQDLEKGRKSEVDSINGVVCKYGEKYGVPTHYNDVVINVIHEIEQGKRKPCFDNIGLFRELP